MVTTRPPKTIVKPTALGPVANTDTKLLIYGLFQKGRVLAQDGDRNPLTRVSCWARRPRSRRPCAQAPAYKFLELRVLSPFVFLDTTGSRVCLPAADVTDTMGRCDPTRRASCQGQSIQ